VLITFKTNRHGHPVTESGQPVTCDGCGIRLTTPPTAEQQQEVPPAVALLVYGEDRRKLAPGVAPITYVVCERGIDCLTLAQLADDLYFRSRCNDPLCTGDGTPARPCRSPRSLPADPYGPLN
jgi:hypothetical protein